MLALQDVEIARGAKTLLKNASLVVHNKQRFGLVGSNGCGKTSLFAAIAGEFEPPLGEIRISKHTRLVRLAQEVPGTEQSALDFAMSGDEALAKVFARLNKAEQEEDYDTLMQCHNQLHEMDGYSAQARAAKILKGLGFSDAEMQHPLKSFSGGWRMRIGLARCLFAPSDLLLLDEPTNHLDMEAIIWLEKYINKYPGSVVLISHDRDFLDHTVTHIAHIDRQQLTAYTGGYSQFESIRAEQLANQQALHAKQQAHIAHMQKFVDRFRAQATKAKQAQSRLKAIAKIEQVAAVQARSPFSFQFMAPQRAPDPMLTLSKVALGYDDVPVVEKVNLSVRAGQRLGLIGVNGAGKTTLIKGLCGELAPLAGEVVRPNTLEIGYFAQHQVDHLDLTGNALALLRREDQTGADERRLTAYLGSFGFSRDQSLSPLKHFSGGEKARMALALIIWQRPNLLLLDEPTNHLDMEMREALMLALQSYEGAIILVTHDRHLMRSLVDELWMIADGRVKTFEGSLEDYQSQVDG